MDVPITSRNGSPSVGLRSTPGRRLLFNGEDMTDSFTKLASTIISSSIWSEDDKTRILWVTMLALCDADGFVAGTVPGLAAMARMSKKAIERSLVKLEAPDPDSRTKANDGRRLMPMDGGWLVLNYSLYRNRERSVHRKAYLREYQRVYMQSVRQEKSNKCLTGVQPSASSSDLSSSVPDLGGSGGAPSPVEELKTFGELNKVRLTQAEYDKVVAAQGKERADAGIEILDTYIGGGKGKKYTCHYAVLKKDSWVWREVDSRFPAMKQGNKPIEGLTLAELEYLKQARSIMYGSGSYLTSDLERFWLKVKDALGKDSMWRIKQAARQRE